MNDELGICPKCQSRRYYDECPLCSGSGVGEDYEDDPFWFLPGEYEPCPDCNGRGYIRTCVCEESR